MAAQPFSKLDCLERVWDRLGTIGWCCDPVQLASRLSASRIHLAEDRGTRRVYDLGLGLQLDVYLTEGTVMEAEVTLDYTPVDRSVMSQEVYDDLHDQYFAKFQDCTSRLTTRLGKPAFLNGVGCRGFPDDQDAEWLSLWQRSGYRLMLEQKHEDPELPFRICLVFAPD
jgi:hypothetical protein